MKKFLIVLLILVVLAVAALGIFLATFDADRYRPLVVEQLQKALGTPVSLEHLSLEWHHGVALQAEGLRIQDPASPSGQPLAEVEDAQALVKIGPLLQKKIEIASVLLDRPRIRVTRDAQGKINATGLAPAAAPAAAAQQPAAQQPAAGGQAPEPIAFSIARFEIRNGELTWQDAAVTPPMEVRVKAIRVVITDIAPGQPLTIQADAAVGADLPNAHVHGRVTLPDQRQAGRIDGLSVEITDLPIQEVAPRPKPGEPTVRGRLSLSFDGDLPDLTPERAIQTVSGSAKLNLQEGVLLNVNIFRSVLEQLSIIPGLVEKLQSELPPEYLAKLDERDTKLLPIDVAAQLKDGGLEFNDLAAGTDVLELSGSGRVNLLQRTVQSRPTLRFAQPISAIMVRSVKELNGLSDDKGRIAFPVIIDTSAQPPVLPDLNYIQKRLITTVTTDLLGDLLKRALGPEEEASPGPGQPAGAQPEQATPGSQQNPSSSSSQSAPQPATTEDALGLLLRRALKEVAPAEKPVQTR